MKSLIADFINFPGAIAKYLCLNGRNAFNFNVFKLHSIFRFSFYFLRSYFLSLSATRDATRTFNFW